MNTLLYFEKSGVFIKPWQYIKKIFGFDFHYHTMSDITTHTIPYKPKKYQFVIDDTVYHVDDCKEQILNRINN